MEVLNLPHRAKSGCLSRHCKGIQNTALFCGTESKSLLSPFGNRQNRKKPKQTNALTSGKSQQALQALLLTSDGAQSISSISRILQEAGTLQCHLHQQSVLPLLDLHTPTGISFGLHFLTALSLAQTLANGSKMGGLLLFVGGGGWVFWGVWERVSSVFLLGWFFINHS